MKHDSPISMNQRRSTARPGFTLVEMLVVIAIIGILAAMAAWGVFAMIGNQQYRNTQSTIIVVNKVMQDHWKYVIEEAKKDAVISPAVVALAQPDPTGQRARVLWIKVRLMEAFPQAYTDITAPPVYTIPFPTPTGPGFLIPPSTIPPTTAGIQQRYIADYLKLLVSPTLGNNVATTQSPACLLMALSVNRGGSVLNQDQIKFAVKDTDGDGIMEIVDGWGRPLMFTRFDNSPLVQQANPASASATSAKFADPVDSQGMLFTPNWYAAAPPTSRLSFETLANYKISTTGATANYVIPSIMSAGKDGVMPSPDDIYNYQLRGN